MNKKQLIPRLTGFILILLMVQVLFYSWHDGRGKTEVFIIEPEGSSFHTELRDASYPLLILRPDHFPDGDVSAGVRVLRYRSAEDFSAQQAGAVSISEYHMTTDAGRESIHRLAALDIKLGFTAMILILSTLYLYFFVSLPLNRKKRDKAEPS